MVGNMGTSFSISEKVEPTKISDDKKNDERTASENSENWRSPPRSMTDVLFLIIMSFFLIVLCCFLGYCILNGDIFRIINGYDNCGNICGQSVGIIIKNSTNCEKSNKERTFHLVMKRNNTKIKDRYCVKNCSDFQGYRQFLNRCVPNVTHKTVDKFFAKTGISNFFQEASEDIHLCYKDILILCLISLALSTLLLISFRYLVGYVVWFILVGVIAACSVTTVWLWISWKKIDNEHELIEVEFLPIVEHRKKYTYLVFAITSSVLTVIVILVILVLRKRIELVVQLFRESGKALASMPVLIFLPILTFIWLTFVVSLWFLFALWIESSGRLAEKSNGIYHYEKDGWMRLTRWLNIFGMLWQAQFLIGCQHIVIAGAVSIWYFTRDKSKLGSPINQSFYNLIRFHLGSVALGSLIIAVVQFLRIILKIVEKNLRRREGSCSKCVFKCCQCCLYCFEKILKYLTRNAYIEVATYGYSFCKGGRQAFRLLVANAMRVTAINSVGDFTLFLGKVIVVITTVFIGIKMLEHKEGLQHMWVPVTLAALFAYLIAHSFMTVYEMIIDTIFLCFCEDCEKNDGIDRPYYMSRGLMSFVENSKKVIELHDRKKYRPNNKTEVSPSNDEESQHKMNIT
ncbi:hypothetical protein HHI36_018383 [Cryptolaemus montrouzieri]|uniref:Choline transporter-like protein n=1 Tax=Cryptolaemus montrouzieri TaxID=559131 RepID=A0ABD2P086_9CUCU